jgi:hypothetical protein
MKNNKFPKLELLNHNLPQWILGFILALPIVYSLDKIAWTLHPSHIDEFYTWIDRFRTSLILLAILLVVTPLIRNAIEIFCIDLDQENKSDRSYFKFSFHLDGIKHSIPNTMTVILIILEKAFIITMLFYLRKNYDRGLYDSMDFLIGGPGPILLVAYLLLWLDCFSIFCLLLFSFYWGYSWVQWVSDKIFPGFTKNKFYAQTILIFSVIFRVCNLLGLIFVVNRMVTSSYKFNAMVTLIYKLTLLLSLGVVIYIVPYFRERAASQDKLAAASLDRT